MEDSAAPTSDAYAAHRSEVEGDRLTRSSRSGALLVAALNTAFIPLDYFAFREHFAWMLALRLVCDAIMAVIFLRTARTHPLPSAFVGCLVLGFTLLVVIGAAGGVTSPYTPGLMLLFLGMPVLLPFNAVQSGGIVAALFAGLALLPVFTPEPVVVQSYLLALVFPLCAGIESVLACELLDRLRFADFLHRREVERARDELKELDREKSRFTANVHHELRTPLTLTLAPIDAMLAGDFGEVNDVQRSYLHTMQTNAQRLLKLINNLLDLAKIEGQQLSIERVPTDLGALVAQLSHGAAPLAERKGVALEIDCAATLPIVNADRDALEKVIVNLLGNALKFTESGDRIGIVSQPHGDGGVELVVTDSGAGLEPEQLERIFDRFAQVDSSSTRKHEGTGIGLALVKELVELHDGRVWAESDGLGCGARFHVTLPVGEADAARDEDVLRDDAGASVALDSSMAAIEAELGLAEREGPEAPYLELERTVERGEFDRDGEEAPSAVGGDDIPEVLICEDNADMRRLLAYLIGREYRVRVARNGADGLAALRASAPDLLLTDVMMPVMSGLELCEAVKSDPATRGIPVVLVTSKAEREMKIEGLELGADDYVTKPFHPRELMARVRSLVGVRRLQAELADRNARLLQTNDDLATALADLKETESQLVQSERLAAIGELAAGVAHEINNPVNFATNALTTLRAHVDELRVVLDALTGIDWEEPGGREKGLAEVERLRAEVGFEDLADALGELVTIVTEGLQRSHRLVGDLQSFASPHAGQRSDVDLRRGLESTVQLLRPTARHAGVSIETDFASGLPTLRGDAPALNQVFLNLLKNAAEALDGRGGTICVGTRLEEASIMIEIRDDGPGIAPELLPRLFEPFFTTKEGGRGTGLGLSICQRIVSEHGGTITVESQLGRGTTFRVSLPLEPDAGSERDAS